MGRIKQWLPQHYEEWCALRREPAFASLEQLVSRGLNRIDQPELQALVEASPTLAAASSLSEIKATIRDAGQKLADSGRANALLVVLRATDESANLPTDSIHRLARVKLGEGDGHISTLERRLNRAPTSLQLADAIPKDSSNFRRKPELRRKPGDLFFLLRELYRDLVPGADIPVLVSNENGHDEVKVHPASLALPSKPARRRAPTKSNIEVVREAIRRHCQTELELTQFARVILTDLDVIENLTIDVKLTDDGEDWFDFNVVREFHAQFKEYTVGIVLGDESRAVLSRCIPELKDVIWLPPETQDLDAVANEIVRDGLLEVIDRRSKSGFTPLLFLPLPANHEFLARIARTEAVTDASYRLLTADFDPGSGEHVHYRSTLCMPLHRTRRRCAWFADGPTFIDGISIDLSEFRDAAESDHTNVYFMLPGTSNYSDVAERDDKRFKREVRDWVVRHHGFIIHW
ncbi:MAG: hypothetical protein ACM3VU_00240 [Arthrospira platensis]